MFKSKKLSNLKKQLKQADSYQEWCEIAQIYDKKSGFSRWRRTERSDLYDYVQIRQRLDRLRHCREKNDDHCLLFILNEGIHGNMGGMGRSVLYSRSKVGTKHLIEEYTDELVSALRHIAQVDESIISREEKIDLFTRASHCCGRSALMLSGGGSLGHFHLGVLKALLEQDLLPSVLSGSSAGSLVTAYIGTHTREEVLEYLHSDKVLEEAKEEVSWINRVIYGKSDNNRMDVSEVQRIINRLIPDLTFQEAYDLSGYKINISVAPSELHQTSRLLNAITSPNVYIRTAILASCAVPGVYPAVTLMAKGVNGDKQPYLPTRKWIDGSVSDDLPAKRLARLYGVNHYIGSLINPIVMVSHKDAVERSELGNIINKVTHYSISQWAKTANNLTIKYGKNWPRLKLFTNMINSVLQQNYDADIVIFPDFKAFKLSKILSPLTAEELLALVRQGEIATWEKMDMIRGCSKISRVLDEIMDDYIEPRKALPIAV